MHKVVFGILLIAFPVFASGNAHYFDRVDAFLKKHVHDGKVDYSAIKSQPDKLHAIVEMQKSFDLANLKPTARKAFWINAYNILVIQAVVQAYPIDSPMDVPGFFDAKTFVVAGDTLTLNQIENEKLRAEFGDPRIHFALVCAAQSCPPIIPAAYRPQKLDSQLEERTRSNLNDSDFIRVSAKEKKVYLSEIFKWYREDFVTSERGVLAYINRYRNKKIPADYRIDYYTYNWALNDYKEEKTGYLRPERDNLQAYTPSTLLFPGEVEIKTFNNLYTQTAFFNEDGEKVALGIRSSFFTNITSFMFGISPRLNFGADMYFKSVHNDDASSSPFSVLQFSSGQNSRTAVTSFVPKVKFSPIFGSVEFCCPDSAHASS